jgi:hypothetical protein
MTMLCRPAGLKSDLQRFERLVEIANRVSMGDTDELEFETASSIEQLPHHLGEVVRTFGRWAISDDSALDEALEEADQGDLDASHRMCSLCFGTSTSTWIQPTPVRQATNGSMRLHEQPR